MDAALIHIITKGIVDGFRYDTNEQIVEAARVYCQLRLLCHDFRTSLDYWLPPLRAKHRLVMTVCETGSDGNKTYYVLPNGLKNGECRIESANNISIREFYFAGALLKFNMEPISGIYMYGDEKKYVSVQNNRPVEVDIKTDYGAVVYDRHNMTFAVSVTVGGIDVREAERLDGSYDLSICTDSLLMSAHCPRTCIYRLRDDSLFCDQVIRETHSIREITNWLEKLATRYKWTIDTTHFYGDDWDRS